MDVIGGMDFVCLGDVVQTCSLLPTFMSWIVLISYFHEPHKILKSSIFRHYLSRVCIDVFVGYQGNKAFIK